MRLSRSVARALACVLCGLLFVGLSCDGNGDGAAQPTITLTAVGCPVTDIDLSVKITKRRGPSKTTTTVTIEVTCMGEALAEAELRVDFWGLTLKKIKTNEEGKARASKVTSLDTTGLKVTVTMIGKDEEEKDEVVEVPAN